MASEASFPALAITLVLGCGDSPREITPTPPPTTPAASHLEQTIATQLSAKLGRAAHVSCTKALRCRADLGDAVLPIVVTGGSGDATWAVDGLLVRAAPIEAYLKDALVDLGVPQTVRCGSAIRSVAPGTRIECTLERGGKAFAVIAGDGSFSTEIDLDPAAAAARSSEPNQPLVGSGSPGTAAGDDD